MSVFGLHFGRLKAMGYNIHITRGNWWDDSPGQIGYEEWRALAETDPEFRRCGETLYSDEALFEDGPPAPVPSPAVRAYASYALATHPAGPTFDYYGGTVRVRGGLCDRAVLAKMLEVAGKLGAVVQGDEGESYRLTSDGSEAFEE